MIRLKNSKKMLTRFQHTPKIASFTRVHRRGKQLHFIYEKEIHFEICLL